MKKTRLWTGVAKTVFAILAFALAMGALPAFGNHYILCSESAKCDPPPWPPDGTDDSSAKSRFYAIPSVVQSDGKVVVGGGLQHDPMASFSRAGYFFAVKRLNADGSPDFSFNGTGLAQIPIWGYYEFVDTLIVQPDGKIIAGGNSADPIGISDASCYPAFCKIYPTLIRLNSDGTLDQSFNGSGRLILEIGDANRGPEVDELGMLLGLELQPDGKIIVRSNGPLDVARLNGDGSLTYDHLTDVARVDADGTLDASFVGTTKVAREIPYFVPPATLNFQGLWWNASPRRESGWGINLIHQGDTIFATWLTYDANGKSWWLSMTAKKAASNLLPAFTGDVIVTRGPPFSTPPTQSNAVSRTVVGTGTIIFSGLDFGSFVYSVNGITQTKTISRMIFGPLPTCEYFTQPPLSTTVNYQNLWWAPNGGGDGWGLNITHQGDTIFATWFTYGSDGTPLWLSMTASRQRTDVYSGTLVRTTGPAFGADPFDPALVARTDVGTATITFSSASSGNFAYTVNGVAGSNAIVPAALVPPAVTLCR